MAEQDPRKWYQKKRYILSLSAVGLFFLIGILSPSSTPSSTVQSNTKTQSQVKSDTITLPAEVAPLRLQQEQPTQEQATQTQEATTAEAQPTNTPPAPVQPSPPAAETVKPTPPPVQKTVPQAQAPTPPTYYTNVDGNKVPSPVETPDGSIPVGATARCRDGSYSSSQHRSGTCSHHGGVAEWL